MVRSPTYLLPCTRVFVRLTLRLSRTPHLLVHLRLQVRFAHWRSIGASYAYGLLRLLRGDSQIATARRTIGRPFVSSAGWPDDPNRRHHFRVLAAFYCDIDGASCRSRNSHTCSLATRSDTSVRRQHRCAEYCCLTLAEADKRSRDARSARDLYGRLQLILWRWPDRRTSTTLQYGAERDGAQP